MTNKTSTGDNVQWVAQLFGLVLVVAMLYFARDVFIPMALGLLLSFLLSPVVRRLHRWGVPNVAAVVATAALAFVLLGVGFTLMGRELTTLVSDLPQHKDELVAKAGSLSGLTSGMGGGLDELADEVTEAIEGGTEPLDESRKDQNWAERLLSGGRPSQTVRDGSSAAAAMYIKPVDDNLAVASWATTAGTVLGPLATAGLVSVFALFMLIHREDLRDRIIAVVSQGDYVTTTEALDEAGNRISRYLIAQTIVNTSYGFVLTMGLFAIGLTLTEEGFPNVVLWGVLATSLRFVPYIGPVASAVFPLGIALSVFPGYTVFLAVLGLIIAMELISNNVLEPWLYGASTGISAVAVIVAAVFWGWLWGPVGLLLSTPLTVCLVVLGRYVPRFKLLATLLSEDLPISAAMRFYQRLLSSDTHAAIELLRSHKDREGFLATCDNVIVPTIRRIRRDEEIDRLSESDSSKLFALLGGVIEDPAWRRDAEAKPDGEGASDTMSGFDVSSIIPVGEDTADDRQDNLKSEPRPIVVGCAAHHYSESLVLNLLRIVQSDRFELRSVADDLLPSHYAAAVIASHPVAVVITLVPSGGFQQARFLCRTIRQQNYDGAILVCCCGKFKNYDKLFVKFRKAGATSMTTSLTQTHSKLMSLIQGRDPGVGVAATKTPSINDDVLTAV